MEGQGMADIDPDPLQFKRYYSIKKIDQGYTEVTDLLIT